MNADEKRGADAVASLVADTHKATVDLAQRAISIFRLEEK